MSRSEPPVDETARRLLASGIPAYQEAQTVARTREDEQLLALVHEREERAYRKGWEDAVRAVANAASSMAPPEMVSLTQCRSRRGGRRGAIPEFITGFLKDQSGADNESIIAEAKRAIEPPPHEQAVRTALRRLEGRGEIVRVGKGWTLAGAPAQASEQLGQGQAEHQRDNDETVDAPTSWTRKAVGA